MSEWETPRILPTLQERKEDKVKFDPRVTTISSKTTNQENAELPASDPPTSQVPTLPSLPANRHRPKLKVACNYATVGG